MPLYGGAITHAAWGQIAAAPCGGVHPTSP